MAVHGQLPLKMALMLDNIRMGWTAFGFALLIFMVRFRDVRKPVKNINQAH
jgi:hypothetical protein